MKTKYLFWLLIPLMLFSCKDSQYELDNLVPKQYHLISYIKNYGTHNLNLFTTQKEVQDTLVLIKSGSDPKRSSTLHMSVLSQQLLDSIYSQALGINYQLIPSTAYNFNDGAEIQFNSETAGQYFPITFKPLEIYKLIESNPSAKFALPLQLVSSADSVNSDMNNVLYVVDVKSPVIGFQQNETFAKMIYKSLDIEVPMIINNCDANKWDITGTLNDTNLDQFATQYNSFHGTNYNLLPKSAYVLNSLGFSKGSLIGSLKMTINRAQLENDKTYILPLVIKSTSMSEQMQIDTQPVYLIIANPYYGTREIDRSNWKILFCNNDNRVGGTSDNAGAKAILDNNLNTYWHTGWQLPKASSFSQNNVNGDDYDYTNSQGYHAFKGSRSANNTVIAIDLGAESHLVSVGIIQRPGSYTDMHEADIYASTDSEFKFTPVGKGGNIDDYTQVALNNWNLFMSISVPHDSDLHWFDLNSNQKDSGGVKGRMIKIAFKTSYRDPNLSFAEFKIIELLSINGEAVK